MKEKDHLSIALKQLDGKAGNAPEPLREDVFSTLDTVRLFADIVDLFTVKFTQVELLAFDAAFSFESLKDEEDKE